MKEQYYYIGEAAGKIYNALKESGETTPAKLQKSADVKEAALFNRALGWLAREEKIDFVQKGKTQKVQISQTAAV